MAAITRTLSSFLFLASGCIIANPKPPPQAPVYEGDASGRASLESLPSMDVEDDKITSEMRIARLLSAESLSYPDPERPQATSADAIQAWSDEVLKAWIEVKHERAEAARAELDRAAVQNHRQRIMAGALVGLVYEDVARVLMTIPVPDDLKNEPEIADMFREIVASQALPYLTHARRAYEACAQNAVQPATMNHWSGFCKGRADQLPHLGEASQPALGAGKTEVTVVSR